MKKDEKEFLDELNKKYPKDDFNSIKQNITVNPKNSRNLKGFLFGGLITAGAACLAIGATFIAINSINKSGVLDNANTPIISSEQVSEAIGEESKYIDGKYRIVEVSNIEAGSEADVAYVKPWDQKELFEKYSYVSYNNVNYDVGSSAKMGTLPLEEENVGEALGEATAIGYDMYESVSGGYKDTTVEIFSIKGISTNAAVAAKFLDSSYYYPYVNYNYKFANVGDFLTTLNFEEFGNIGERISYWYTDSTNVRRNVVFENVNQKDILDTFFFDKEQPIEQKMKVSGTGYFTISIGLRILNLDNLAFTVDRNGYVMTNLFGYPNSFYVGEEKINGFFDYLHENYEGVVYINIPIESGSESTGHSGETTESYLVSMGSDPQ